MKLPRGITNPNDNPICCPKNCVEVHGSQGVVVLKASDTYDACNRYNVNIAYSIYQLLEDPVKGEFQLPGRS